MGEERAGQCSVTCTRSLSHSRATMALNTSTCERAAVSGAQRGGQRGTRTEEKIELDSESGM